MHIGIGFREAKIFGVRFRFSGIEMTGGNQIQSLLFAAAMQKGDSVVLPRMMTTPYDCDIQIAHDCFLFQLSRHY